MQKGSDRNDFSVSETCRTSAPSGRELDVHVFQGMSKYELSMLAIVSSVGEEILFRGFLQSYWGLWLTSLVFGLLHIPMQKHHWPWTVMAVIMGVVFGSCYEWRGTLTAPLIAHFTINYFNLHALASPKTPNDLTST